MKKDKENEPCIVHNHEPSMFWIPAIVLAIAIGVVGEKAVNAWKEVQLQKTVEVKEKSK